MVFSESRPQYRSYQPAAPGPGPQWRTSCSS